MRWSAFSILMMGSLVHGQTLPPANQPTVTTMPHGVPLAQPSISTVPTTGPVMNSPVMMGGYSDDADRNLFESDRDFDSFIGPITSPVLSKDPRSLTELRGLFINNWFPDTNGLTQGGNFQVYAMQARLALTDRLTFIADKDGIATISPRSAKTQSGFLNVAAGLKYTLIRNVETQTLGTLGFMYEMPSGESKVFQGHGSGVWTVFGVFGQRFEGDIHVILNEAFQFAQNSHYNSNFFFTQLHIDKGFGEWLYPLVEVNWYKYVSGGDRGIPALVGEADGLINLGTSGMNGKDLVTGALGLKAKISPHFEVGAAWETPLSSRKDLISNRLTAEVILRY